jgi:hypothetical protein
MRRLTNAWKKSQDIFGQGQGSSVAFEVPPTNLSELKKYLFMDKVRSPLEFFRCLSKERTADSMAFNAFLSLQKNCKANLILDTDWVGKPFMPDKTNFYEISNVVFHKGVYKGFTGKMVKLTIPSMNKITSDDILLLSYLITNYGLNIFHKEVYYFIPRQHNQFSDVWTGYMRNMPKWKEKFSPDGKLIGSCANAKWLARLMSVSQYANAQRNYAVGKEYVDKFCTLTPHSEYVKMHNGGFMFVNSKGHDYVQSEYLSTKVSSDESHITDAILNWFKRDIHEIAKYSYSEIFCGPESFDSWQFTSKILKRIDKKLKKKPSRMINGEPYFYFETDKSSVLIKEGVTSFSLQASLRR